MANIYAIKARIKGVESTRKITKTMKLVSTSKLHQTQGQLYRLGSFAEKCRQSLNLVLDAAQGEDCRVTVMLDPVPAEILSVRAVALATAAVVLSSG